jgi:hypothetical protein
LYWGLLLRGSLRVALLMYSCLLHLLLLLLLLLLRVAC